MIHIGFSGGGLKGIGHLGVSEKIEPTIKADILSGISVGSIMAIVYAMVMCKIITWKEVRDVFFNLTSKKIFKVHPYSIKAIIRGILSFFIPKLNSLGNQSNLDNLLREVISEDNYKKLISHPECPIIYVGYVDYNLGDLRVVNINDYKYKTAIKYILASSHVPIATEAIKLNNHYGYDGGLVDHCLSGYIIDIYKYKIHTNINIFTRAYGNQLISNFKPKNIFNVAKRTVEIGINRISRDDEKYIDLACKYYGVKNYSVYLPTVLDNMYDFKLENLLILYYKGAKAGNKLLEKWQY